MENESLTLTIDSRKLSVPKTLLYTRDGLWVQLDGDVATIGLSDPAQELAGRIIYIDFAAEGTILSRGDKVAELETAKAIHPIRSPYTGTLLALNQPLFDMTEKINEDPYGEGWIARIQATEVKDEQVGLLSAEAYLELAGNQLREAKAKAEAEKTSPELGGKRE